MKFLKRLFGATVCLCALMCTPAMAEDSVIPAVNWSQETRTTQYGRIISCFGFQGFEWDTDTYDYVGTWYRYQKTDKTDLQSVGELVINDSVPKPCQTPNDLPVGTYYYYAEITAREAGTDDVVETNTSPVNTIIVGKATPAMRTPGGIEAVWPSVGTGYCGQTLDEIALTGGSAINADSGAIVKGRFEWKNKNDKLTKNSSGADTKVGVIFTPNDDTNYNRMEDASVLVKVSHAWVDATCTTAKTCEGCGATQGKPLDHDFTGDAWENDDDNHWKKCSRCDTIDAKNPHSWDSGVVTQEATCTTAGKKTFTCTTCNATKTETLNALDHDFADTWTSDADNHWKKCSRCDAKSENKEHTWNDGEITILPTCTTAGEKTYTCSVCDKTKTEDVPANSHTGGTATCIAKATCDVCKQEYGDKNPDNHAGDLGDWLSDSTQHWKAYSCCGIEADRADHSGGTATCIAKAKCDTCGVEYGDLAAHNYTAETVKEEALKTPGTCKDAAVYYYSCAVCGKVESEESHIFTGEKDAANHVGSLGEWQSNSTQHWKVYDCCQAEADKAAHRYDNDRDTTCNDCGYTRTIAPTPSSSGSGSSNSSATAAASSTITVPVSGSEDTVRISASVSNNTAEVKEVKQSELDKIGTESSVTIDLSSLGSVTGVQIPVDTVTNVAASESDGMEIKLPHVQLHIDSQALNAIATQAEGKDIRLVVETENNAETTLTPAQKQALDGMKNAAVLEAYFVSGSQRIRDFKGGEVELYIPYQTSGAIRAWYLKEDGTREPVAAEYDSEKACLILHHFSHYVIEEVEEDTATPIEAAMSYADCKKDASCPLADYTDLTTTAWYHDGVHYCIENGLIRGFADAKFQPNGSTTRAQLIMILWRMEGSPVVNDAMSYGDVAEDAWYREAIRWAASEDIAQGYDSKRFAPNDAVTREQMVSILWRFAKWKGCNVNIGENTNILSYEDALIISEYAVPSMQWACGSGLLHGDGANLLPKSGATRAQAATLMMHFCEEYIK